jgi:hypothetical protein
MMTQCRAPPMSRLTRPQAGTDGSTHGDDSRPPRFADGPARGTAARVAYIAHDDKAISRSSPRGSVTLLPLQPMDGGQQGWTINGLIRWFARLRPA